MKLILPKEREASSPAYAERKSSLRSYYNCGILKAHPTPFSALMPEIPPDFLKQESTPDQKVEQQRQVNWLVHSHPKSAEQRRQLDRFLTQLDQSDIGRELKSLTLEWLEHNASDATRSVIDDIKGRLPTLSLGPLLERMCETYLSQHPKTDMRLRNNDFTYPELVLSMFDLLFQHGLQTRNTPSSQQVEINDLLNRWRSLAWEFRDSQKDPVLAERATDGPPPNDKRGEAHVTAHESIPEVLFDFNSEFRNWFDSHPHKELMDESTLRTLLQQKIESYFEQGRTEHAADAVGHVREYMEGLWHYALAYLSYLPSKRWKLFFDRKKDSVQGLKQHYLDKYQIGGDIAGMVAFENLPQKAFRQLYVQPDASGNTDDRRAAFVRVFNESRTTVETVSFQLGQMLRGIRLPPGDADKYRNEIVTTLTKYESALNKRDILNLYHWAVYRFKELHTAGKVTPVLFRKFLDELKSRCVSRSH